MSLKRIFFPQRIRGHNSGDFPLEITDENEPIEQDDRIEPLTKITTSDEQQHHRSRRQSSVQILDKKFLHHSLSIHNENEPNDLVNSIDDLRECE